MMSRATVHMFKRRISIFTCLVAVTGLITVCVASEAEKADVRTPQIFLRAIHEIIDVGDLLRYQIVSKKLHLKLDVSSQKKVFSSDGIFLGEDTTYELSEDHLNIFERPLSRFSYGGIRLAARNFDRVILSANLNQKTLCITLSDLMQEFGSHINQSISTDLGPTTYSYGFNKDNALALSVRFDKNGCMSHLMLSQNTARN